MNALKLKGKEPKQEIPNAKKEVKQAARMFNEYLQGQGFIIRKIRMDGNCLFRSISHQLTNSDKNYATYRELVVNHLRSNENMYKDFVDIDSHGSFTSYVDRMAKNRVWGGHIELMALSEILSVKFCIITETKEIIWVNTNGDDDVQILYLAYHRSRYHYFSIKRSTENSKLNDTSLSKSDDEKDEKEEKEEALIKKKVLKKIKKSNIQKEELEMFNQEKLSQNMDSKNHQMEIEIPISERKIVKVKTKPKIDESLTLNNKLKKKTNFKDIFILENKELVYWCVEKGLLKKPSCCQVCRRRAGKIKEVRLSGSKKFLDKVIWRCKDRSCGGIINIRRGNKLFEAFSKIKLRFILIYIFTHFTVMLSPDATCKTLGVSKLSMRRLYQMISNWVIEEQINDERKKGKFGGENAIIEMDESCFFGRKNNKGRVLKQIWAFGFVERDIGRFFAQVVSKRDRSNLIPIITRWIRPNCKMIITDEWKPYKVLKKLGYNHESVKHKDNFVRQDNPIIHTQTIERRWGMIKSKIKKEEDFQGNLSIYKLKK